MKKMVLAADLGGTNLRMAVIGENGETKYRSRSSTPSSRRREDVVDLLVGSARECIEATRSDGTISAFGIAAPAVLDHEAGRVLVAPNLPELNDFSLASAVSGLLGIEVFLENDANAAAIGENWLGASHGFNSSICVTLGTGVGGGVIIDGKPLRGIDGTAGEIGHICVEPFGHPCGCGSVGCLEQYSSATAVVRMAKELLSEFPDSSFASGNDLSSLDVYNAAISGDPLANEVFRRFGFYLGVALGGLINVLNPEVIVIGGGASESWDVFIEPLNQEIRKRAFKRPADRVIIVKAKLGDDAGILGVAKLAFSSSNIGLAV
ncbi:MAG: ROK family protein [Acidobacteria bacterium]|nr:ROK family protein [Acidobacteriota bacterium]